MVSNFFLFQVPGFQSFVIEAFAINCCLYSVLDKSFEFRDANTVSTYVIKIKYAQQLCQIVISHVVVTCLQVCVSLFKFGDKPDILYLLLRSMLGYFMLVQDMNITQINLSYSRH